MKYFAVIILTICILVTGCYSSYEKKVEGLEELSKKYLAIKQPDELEHHLLKMVQFLDEGKSNAREQYLKSSVLMYTYLRLSIIEEKRGDLAKADIYFQKARYFYICMLESEFRDNTSSEISKKISEFTPQEGRELLLAIDPEFLNMVNSLSQSHTGKNKNTSTD